MAPRVYGRSQTRPKNTFFEVLPCGVHHIEKVRNKYDQIKDVVTPYRRQLKKGEKRGECLCDFHSFEELTLERTTLSAEYKELPKKKIFPFLKLAGEIRNQIYEELFVFAQPIEFCPEPFHYNGSLDRWNKQYHQDHQRVMIHQRKFLSQMRSAKCFMRTSKQIHAETSPIFYGQNVFSFSSVAGWVHLDFFLHKIDLRKCGMLRKIIVNHPNTVSVPRSNKGDCEYAQASRLIWPRESKEPGFVFGKRWFDYYEYPSSDPTLILNRLGKLEQLGITIPIFTQETSKRRYEDFPVAVPSNLPIDPAKFDKVKVTLFMLESEYTRNFPRAQWPEIEQIAAEMTVNAAGHPVEAITTRVHAQGRYATGFIKDFAEDLAELQTEEAVFLAAKAAVEAEEQLRQIVWQAEYTALPAEDEEGL
ncbi:hypothetical protein Slin14017_G125640 [Septoria linicola]|nr:hypothetical protein Slin14017_G125640 [Septoria linicola]